MGQFTTGVLASTAPWTSTNPAWAANVTALAAMFEPVAQLVMDSGSPDEPETYMAGWSTLLNVDTCPDQYLPYLGQFLGIYIAPGTAGATARAIINAKSNWTRGTPTAIVMAAQRFLTGTQQVTLLERTAADGAMDPYHFVLVVRPEELLWNLIPNPSFEHDTLASAPAGWSTGGTGTVTTFAVQNGWAAIGSRACRLTATGVTAGAEMSIGLPTLIPCVAGQPYSLTATFDLLNGNTTPSVSVFFYNAGAGVVGSKVVGGSPGPGVQTLQALDAVAPATAVTIGVYCSLGNGTLGTVTVDGYIDAVGLVESASPGPYVDGDQAGYGWTGTAGDSSTTTLAALTIAVNLTKPAGVQWTLEQADEWLISALEAAGYSTLTALEAAFPSITALEGDLP